jgi:hypothetical protein
VDTEKEDEEKSKSKKHGHAMIANAKRTLLEIHHIIYTSIPIVILMSFATS